MNRWLATIVFLSTATLAFGCNDEHHHHDRDRLERECQQLTTCGTCTPTPGCGWCSGSMGGTCVADPNECDSVPEFAWTWDPSGCPGADAGASPEAAPDAAAAGD